MNRRSILFSFGVLLFWLSRSGFCQPTPTDGDYAAGLDLYQQKKYAEALPFFQRAAGQNPGKAMPLYYLACCEDQTGDIKDAALHFYQTDLKSPTPAIRFHADKLKDRLSLEDQEWLEKQLRPVPTASASLDVPTPASGGAAPGPSVPPPPASSPVSAVYVTKQWGFRISTGMDLWDLSDVESEDQNAAFYSRVFKVTNPGINYDKTTPLGGIYLEANPFFALEDGEIGAVFTFYPSNSYTFRITDVQYKPYFDQDKVDLDTFAAAAAGRVYFKVGRGARFFLEPTLGVQTAHMVFGISYQGTSSIPSAASYGFTMDGSTIAAGLGTGFDFKLSDLFSLSFSGGYRYARMEGLTGTFNDYTFPSRNNVPGRAVMVLDPVSGNRYMWFLPTDPSLNYHFYNSNPSSYDIQPMVLDFSGIRLSLDAAFSF